MSELVRHLEVELTLLPSRQCGRRAPIFTGFRGTFLHEERAWEASPILDQVEFVFPGERVSVGISFRTAENPLSRLAPGAAFQLRDDWRVFAVGTVKRLIEEQTDC